jgi:outer membrane murein-binding lipoprotein Lpp
MTEDDMACRVTEVEQRSKSNTHRIDALEQNQEALNALTTSVQVLAAKQENLQGDVGEIKTDVKTLMDKPGRRWDSAVDKILMLLIAAFMTYIISKIGF